MRMGTKRRETLADLVNTEGSIAVSPNGKMGSDFYDVMATTESIKLWINNDWYIPVDQDGYCIGESAEGALGYIIKLSRSGKANFFTALKIPRLLGDTHRENA